MVLTNELCPEKLLQYFFTGMLNGNKGSIHCQVFYGLRNPFRLLYDDQSRWEKSQWMLSAVVPRRIWGCHNKRKYTRQHVIQVGRWWRQRINKFWNQFQFWNKYFSDQPKPFLLNCPLPESHQNKTPASVSLVRIINTFWIYKNIHKTS